MKGAYKPVFLLSFFKNMNQFDEALVEDVLYDFCDFYESRKHKRLPAEKKKCIFDSDDYTQKDAEKIMLGNPFKRFEDMGFMHHTKHLGTIRLDKHIKLSNDELKKAMEWCREGIERYYSK